MNKLILVAEDQEQNRKLFRAILESNGYQVLLVNNGEQAVQAAAEHRPHLILMDIQMPVLDGREATRLIKADTKTRHIPVIAVTSFAMPGDEEEILRAGCDGYLAKPFSISVLLNTIRSFIGT